MERWTREELEQVLGSKDEQRLSRLHDAIQQSGWRTKYHVQSVTGLLSNPCGFSYFNGQWHLFYEWFPYGSVHGMKHWYHVTSSDLVHWRNQGVSLKPDRSFDNFGCEGGTAFPKDDFLYMTYTGNSHDDYGKKIPYQGLAAMDSNYRISKLSRPILEPQLGYTYNQEDPHILQEKGMYYILLGAQNEQEEGKILLYRSSQIATGWEFLGELKVKGYGSFGYMCQGPHLQKIGDQWVLIFSPLGLHKKGDTTSNAFQSVYMIGDMDFETLEFRPNGPYRELDRGFDFFAPQCAAQSSNQDGAILEAWMGCNGYTYAPTDQQGWSGLLTLPRELTIQNGKLMQKPVIALQQLKKDIVFEAVNGNIRNNHIFGRTPKSCVIEVDNPADNNVCLNLFTYNRGRGFEICYSAKDKKLSLDRSEMQNVINPEYGTSRMINMTNPVRKLQIFVDYSSVEVFVNDGEFVLSSRVFPNPSEHMIRMSGRDINLRIYTADSAIQDDFVLFPVNKEEIK